MPSADIGDLGPSQGQAVVYDWKWHYAVRGLLVWFALGLALVLPKANRDRRALLVLVPVLAVSLVWVLVQAVLHMRSAQAYYFDVVVSSLVVGIAVLWLLAPGLGRLGVIARFLSALCLMSAVACVGVASLLSASSSMDEVILPIITAFVAMLLLLAVAATARQCRRNYSPARVLLWLGAWTTIGGVGLLYGCIVVVSVLTEARLPDPGLFARLGLVGLAIGLVLYLLSLPYIVLGLASPFYRTRMRACLGVPPVSQAPDPATPQAIPGVPPADAASGLGTST